MKKIYLFGALASTLVVIPSTATVFAQEGHNITPAILRDIEELSVPTTETEEENGAEAQVGENADAILSSEAEVGTDFTVDSQNMEDEGADQSGSIDMDNGLTEDEEAGLDTVDSSVVSEEDLTNDGTVQSTEMKEEDFGILENKSDSNSVNADRATPASTAVYIEADQEKMDDRISLLVDEQPVQKNKAVFKAGKGTIEDPYQISSAEELDAIRYDLSAHYIQTANIDLKGIDWNPIGMETEEDMQTFTGVFDGANFEINNLTIRETAAGIFQENYGLFAANGGILKNIKLLDMDIEIDAHNMNVVWPNTRSTGVYTINVGGVTGRNADGTIDHCITSGHIDVYLTVPNGMPYSGAAGGQIGGIAGASYRGIVNSENYANIQVKYDPNLLLSNLTVPVYIGGILGYTYCGGLMEEQIKDESMITNCINSGNIAFTSADYSYGLIGGIAGGLAGNAKNVINYGSIQVEAKSSNLNVVNYIGSLFGRVSNPSYMDMETFQVIGLDCLISNALNFGNISITTDRVSVNGMVGSVNLTESKLTFKDFYNLGGTIELNLLDENGKPIEYDDKTLPIYRIANIQDSDRSKLILENCYASSDFLINGKKVSDLIGLDQLNGASLSRAELIELVKKAFPDVAIVNPGETLDEPLPIVTNATFSQDGISIDAESDQSLAGLSIVISEVSETKNNFGLPSNYQAIGYDIHFANKKQVEVKRTGKFIVRLPIPTEFIGKTVRIFHKEDADDEGKELKYSIVDGKYVFETDSFSWFIVAYDKNTSTAVTPSIDAQKPSQIEENQTPSAVNMVNTSQTTSGTNQANVVLEQRTTDSTVKHSPETGVGNRSFGSVFTGLISLLGLSLLGKKRTKNEF